MDKKYYMVKLIPSRPTFSQDMTPDERSTMQQHVVYWRGMMEKGFVITFGPVLDPNGVYGLGIITADDEAQVHAFMANDPATSINTFEFNQMLAVVKS